MLSKFSWDYLNNDLEIIKYVQCILLEIMTVCNDYLEFVWPTLSYENLLSAEDDFSQQQNIDYSLKCSILSDMSSFSLLPAYLI